MSEQRHGLISSRAVYGSDHVGCSSYFLGIGTFVPLWSTFLSCNLWHRYLWSCYSVIKVMIYHRENFILYSDYSQENVHTDVLTVFPKHLIDLDSITSTSIGFFPLPLERNWACGSWAASHRCYGLPAAQYTDAKRSCSCQVQSQPGHRKVGLSFVFVASNKQRLLND